MVVRPLSDTESTSSASLERGIYILRYAGAGSTPRPPVVHVRASFGSEEIVRFVAVPGAPPSTLTHPGTALVIVAEDRAGLQITVRSEARGSLEADLRLEPLQKTDEAQPSVTLERSSTYEHPQLVGHLSRRGDVAVRFGEWLGGPEAPSPIEGIGLLASGDEEKSLQCQALIQRADDWTTWVKPGELAGTRGRSAHLVGVRLRLSEPLASSHDLQGSALFLGAPVVNQTGNSIEFRSQSGSDPLVGLRVSLLQRERPPVKLTSDGERRSRVRVFRAGVEVK